MDRPSSRRTWKRERGVRGECRRRALRILAAACLLLSSSAAYGGEIRDLYGEPGSAAAGQGDPQFDAAANPVTEIGIERTACYGWCPIYTLIVKSDGTFRYVGEEFVERKGRFTGTVPIYDFNLLALYISSSGYMELADAYMRPVTDNPTVYTTVVMNGQRKIVRNYANGGPRKLWAIEELIDHLLDKATWN